MNIHHFSDSSLAQLKSSFDANFYKSQDEWASEFFGTTTWNYPTRVFSDEFELKNSEGAKHFDIENTKALYSKLRHLTVLQATDERMWAYLTHVTFWEYMRTRWPIERIEIQGHDSKVFVESRYLFMRNKDRALLRNGISRLWWYGFISYDKQRADPYELTEVLLSTQDIASNILERTFSRSNKVTRSILAVLAEMNEENRNSVIRRGAFRDLARHINYLGGVSILDGFTSQELRTFVGESLATTTH